MFAEIQHSFPLHKYYYVEYIVANGTQEYLFDINKRLDKYVYLIMILSARGVFDNLHYLQLILE